MNACVRIVALTLASCYSLSALAQEQGGGDDLDVTMQIIVDPNAKLPDEVVRRIPLPAQRSSASSAPPTQSGAKPADTKPEPAAKESERRQESREVGKEAAESARERAKEAREEAKEQREEARDAAKDAKDKDKDKDKGKDRPDRPNPPRP
jgi:membrane protein involved in colicin uptake